jgi:hypothetical protein
VKIGAASSWIRSRLPRRLERVDDAAVGRKGRGMAKRRRADGPGANPDRAGALDIDRVLLDLFVGQLLLDRAKEQEPGPAAAEPSAGTGSKPVPARRRPRGAGVGAKGPRSRPRTG